MSSWQAVFSMPTTVSTSSQSRPSSRSDPRQPLATAPVHGSKTTIRAVRDGGHPSSHSMTNGSSSSMPKKRQPTSSPLSKPPLDALPRQFLAAEPGDGPVAPRNPGKTRRRTGAGELFATESLTRPHPNGPIREKNQETLAIKPLPSPEPPPTPRCLAGTTPSLKKSKFLSVGATDRAAC